MSEKQKTHFTTCGQAKNEGEGKKTKTLFFIVQSGQKSSVVTDFLYFWKYFKFVVFKINCGYISILCQVSEKFSPFSYCWCNCLLSNLILTHKSIKYKKLLNSKDKSMLHQQNRHVSKWILRSFENNLLKTDRSQLLCFLFVSAFL